MTEPPFNQAGFDFNGFDEPINIVGIGGIGSHIAQILVKGGLRAPLTIYDGDTVEIHNRRNQTYEPEHVGMKKILALTEQIKGWGGPEPHQYGALVKGVDFIPGIVFLCVDRMDARKEIWEEFLKDNQRVPLVIETRMDGVFAIFHTLDPCNKIHQSQWIRYWHPDSKAINLTAGCGGPTMLLPSVSMVAGMAVWQLIHYAAIRAGRRDVVLYNLIRFWLNRAQIEAYLWE